MLRYVRIVDHNADNGVGGFILTFKWQIRWTKKNVGKQI